MKQEALRIVEELNMESYLNNEDSLDYYEPFDFRSTGYDSAIYFMRLFIWSEDNDEREWITEHEKEPLKSFCISQAKRILSDLNYRMGEL